MAPPNSSSFSVSVVLPASGCEMIAKVRRRATGLGSVMIFEFSGRERPLLSANGPEREERRRLSQVSHMREERHGLRSTKERLNLPLDLSVRSIVSSVRYGL